MIRFFLNQNVGIGTLVSPGGIRHEYQTFTHVPASIRPLSDSGGALDGGITGKAYKVYFEANISIKQGDQITDQNGARYKVHDFEVREMVGAEFLEVVAIRTEYLP